MSRPFPLAAVLAVRRQREEAEERKLTALGLRLQEIRNTIARVQGEAAQLSKARAQEVNTTHSAAHHQASEARWRVLHQAEAELRKQMLAVEQQRLEQQSLYLAARSGREMLTELEERHKAEWLKRLARGEQKRVEDLFTSRHSRH